MLLAVAASGYLARARPFSLPSPLAPIGLSAIITWAGSVPLTEDLRRAGRSR